MPPSLLAEAEMQGSDCFFRGLLRGKTGPLVPGVGLRGPRLIQVSYRLSEPVFRSIGQQNLPYAGLGGCGQVRSRRNLYPESLLLR
jgi:hypothetical protein